MKNPLSVILGFSILVAILGNGCSKIDGEFSMEYSYINNTNEDVKFTLYGEIRDLAKSSINDTVITYLLEPNQTASFIIMDVPTNRKTVDDNPSGIIKANQILGDSVTVEKGVIRTVYYPDVDGQDQIYNEANYAHERLSDREFRYSFYFE